MDTSHDASLNREGPPLPSGTPSDPATPKRRVEKQTRWPSGWNRRRAGDMHVNAQHQSLLILYCITYPLATHFGKKVEEESNVREKYKNEKI